MCTRQDGQSGRPGSKPAHKCPCLPIRPPLGPAGQSSLTAAPGDPGPAWPIWPEPPWPDQARRVPAQPGRLSPIWPYMVRPLAWPGSVELGRVVHASSTQPSLAPPGPAQLGQARPSLAWLNAAQPASRPASRWTGTGAHGLRSTVVCRVRNRKAAVRACSPGPAVRRGPWSGARGLGLVPSGHKGPGSGVCVGLGPGPGPAGWSRACAKSRSRSQSRAFVQGPGPGPGSRSSLGGVWSEPGPGPV